MRKSKVLIGIIIILSVVYMIYLNKPYKSTDEYLKKNYADLNLQEEENFSGLELLDKDLKDKKIIFAGEYHNLDQNQIVELKLLKYFQKEAGVNYYLEEIGHADAHFINKYLESGDETILKDYFDIYKNQKYYTEERYDHFIDVYRFNQTLPDDEKIKIVGADIESQATYEYILEVVKDKDSLTDELKTVLSKLKDFNYNSKTSYENISTSINELIEDIKNNEEKYKSIFKEDFYGFKLVIKNLYNFMNSYLNSSDSGEYRIKRDSHIYENFKLIDSKLENPVYFGQWGSYHVFQDTLYHNDYSLDINYFAALLNKDKDYKGKILSINYGYYPYKTAKSHNYSYIDDELFKDYLNSDSNATIFKLNNSKSPFKENTINPYDTEAIDYKGNPITNYFQYLILIRDSERSKIVM